MDTHFAQAGGWLLTSADTARQSGRTANLPQLCVEHHLTHVLLAPSLCRERGVVKESLIVEAWPAIVAACEAPPGGEYTRLIAQ